MGEAHLGHQLKRKEEVVKVMLFCKLQRPPLLPLYILLSGEQARQQLLAEAVPGVKPASWGHKVTAGNPPRCGGSRGSRGLNGFPDTHAEPRGRCGERQASGRLPPEGWGTGPLSPWPTVECKAGRGRSPDLPRPRCLRRLRRTACWHTSMAT